MTDATLLLTNGVVIGLYSAEAGIKLAAGARLIAEGKPGNPVRLVRYNSVQEQINTNWLFGSASVTFGDIATSGARPEARFRFTDFPLLATKFHYHFNGGSYMGPMVFHDCHLFGGELKQKYGSATPWTIALTNSILERAITTLGTGSDAVSVYAYNNLVRFGEFKLLAQTGNSWEVRDTLFDNVTLTQPYSTLANSHNGYLNTTRILPNSANDVVLGSLSYSSGIFGLYYQASSSLYNVGSRSASAAGLFHFTVKTTQEKETNSVVDIGVHYPVWDDPALQDYQEISKSLMTADANETCWDWLPAYAINGSLNDPGWHNCSASGSWLRVNLGAQYSVGRVKYHPRQWAGNGTFLSYRIYVTDSTSTNPADWGTEVASGSWSWPNGAETKTVDFTPKVGRYVVWRSMSAVAEPYASANEVWVYQLGSVGPPKQDADNDGAPDYLEDRDGDGSVDSGETDWQSAGDLGLKVRITQPKNNSILP